MHFLLTANDKFFLPAKLCIQSLLEFSDEKTISSIIINDSGLNDKNRSKLRDLHPNVRFILSKSQITSYGGIHTHDWLKVVSSKTQALKTCIEQDLLPVVMLDCDQFILADVTQELNVGASCLLCRRATPAIRPDGLTLKYIGSFFAAMDRGAIDFVERWIERIEQIAESDIAPPYETLALCEVASDPAFTDDLAELSDEVVSSPNTFVPGKTIIYHYKSNGPAEHTGNILLDRSGEMRENLPANFQRFLSDKLELDELLLVSSSSKHSRRMDWEPPEFIREKARTLDELSVIFGSDKGRLKHNYMKFYEDILEKYKDADCSILEIGVANGASLKMWSSYLPKASIHGIDIDAACEDLCFTWKNIKIHIGDAKVMSFDERFDVIIDDGSHVSRDIHDNFVNLWQYLKPGGTYIIEDTYCTFNLSQAKYNPFRSLLDYRRGVFVRLVNLILWNIDQSHKESAIASCFAGREFFCIIRSESENARLLPLEKGQYGLRELNSVARIVGQRVYNVARFSGKRLLRGSRRLLKGGKGF